MGRPGQVFGLVTRERTQTSVGLGSAGHLQGKDHSHLTGHRGPSDLWAGPQVPLHPSPALTEQEHHTHPFLECGWDGTCEEPLVRLGPRAFAPHQVTATASLQGQPCLFQLSSGGPPHRGVLCGHTLPPPPPPRQVPGGSEGRSRAGSDLSVT